MNDDRAALNLCRLFVESLRITGASISVFDNGGRQSTICASDATAARLDELQFEQGSGPSWEAISGRTPVLVDDIQTSAHISPVLGAAMHGLQVGALFAFPMVLGAATVGAVSLYCTGTGRLEPDDERHARRLVDQVTSRAVRHALRTATDETEPADEISTPAMRREVHQATGMILAQLDLTATDAFIRLRSYAFLTGRPIQDVARDVVTRAINFADLP
jgi:hypothetical protein